MVQKSGKNQLRLVVYPNIYRVFYIPGGCLGFPNHQQFLKNFKSMEIHWWKSTGEIQWISTRHWRFWGGYVSTSLVLFVLPKNSDYKDSTTITYSCRRGQIKLKNEQFLATCYLVHTHIQVTPTSNFHKNNPSTSDYKVSRVWFRIFYGFSCSAHLKGSWKLWNSHTSSFKAVGPVEEISRRPLESVNSKKQKSTAMKWWQKKNLAIRIGGLSPFFVPFC